MTYTQGYYTTRAGWDARIVQLKQDGMNWRADGYVVCPNTGARVLWSWCINGMSITNNPDADLMPNTVGAQDQDEDGFDGTKAACIIPFNAYAKFRPVVPEVY